MTLVYAKHAVRMTIQFALPSLNALTKTSLDETKKSVVKNAMVLWVKRIWKMMSLRVSLEVDLRVIFQRNAQSALQDFI